MDPIRRKYLSTMLKGGAWATLFSHLSMSAKPLSPSLPSKQNEGKASASHTMVFASPYASADYQYCPHMHREFQQHIRTFSKGELYLDVIDQGAIGVGHELMASVSRGTISSALVSIANLTPAAPELDILNIPFWAAEPQRYLNLVTSDIWKTLILDKISSQGNIDILFHYIPGARTISTPRSMPHLITQPSELEGKIIRVAKSRVLAQFYKMTGASAVDVSWKDVAMMAKTGKVEAFDPCAVGLFNGPNGLRHQIGTISQLNTVTDGWVAVVNKKWFRSLPLPLQTAVRDASEQTFIEHINTVTEVKTKCLNWFTNRGVKVCALTDDERHIWVDRFGPQNQQWNELKRAILGKPQTFALLEEATFHNNGYFI